MTTPLWCVAIGCLLPYVWGILAQAGRFKKVGRTFDNKLPRVQQMEMTGWCARAYGAHNNAFEAIIVFAPAVIVATMTSADPVWMERLAIAWVGLRVAHGLLYIANVDIVRTLSFVAAYACAIGMFVLAAQA
jgi:uncharacterized MAPEG superfamily protein